ncbi:MAG TPA: ABC transporter permease [Bryobacteraceae bacterium]|nr:ABC transporter permease [Bryobacteraceae bacterium]
METLWHELRQSMRMLTSKPGFTAIAVSVLALGIGANSAIFSLVNAFLLKPLLFEKPEEIVGVYSRDSRNPGSYRAFSYPNYVDLRANPAVFTNLAAHNMAMVGLAEGEITRRVFADIASSNYFETLGVPIWQGRAFNQAEEQPGSGIPVTIVSYSFWKKSGADRAMLGKQLRINGRVFTVVGIAPEGFSGTTALLSPELYLPFGMYEPMINDFEGAGRRLAARDNHSLILVGRLHSGLAQKSADAQLAVLASGLAKAYPAENKDQTFLVHPLGRLSISTNPSDDTQLTVLALLLLAMSAIVLLIASLNVANMMLARGSARRKEIAIRLALGGNRASILRQLFTEGLMLALLGGGAGLLLSYWSTTLLIRSLTLLAPVDVVYNASPDVRVLAVTLGFCTLSTLLFALAPAWNLSRPDVVSDLKDGAQNLERGKPRRVFSRRNVLVMGQISLSLMLLTAAGLFLRSFLHAANVQPGFRIENALLIELDPSLAGYDETHGRQMYRALLDRLGALPGVESASLAATVPFGMVSLGRGLQKSSDAPGDRPDSRQQSEFNIVSDGYFATLGIPLLRGRTFSPSESGAATPPVAILDQLSATRLWPNGDGLGKHIRITGGAQQKPLDAEVVGIVGNVQGHIIGRGQDGHLYVPFGQEYQANMTIHLKIAARSHAAEQQLLETVRGEIRAVDSRLPVLALRTMRDHLDRSADIWVVGTGSRMFGIFGAVALLLAMIGLYGVRAYTVSRRTREIGIRMALGATRRDTLRLILREGVMIASIGVSAGLALSWLLGRLIASMLYEVTGSDAMVFVASPVLLTAVSLLACYLPAQKASKVDPMTALRYE